MYTVTIEKQDNTPEPTYTVNFYKDELEVQQETSITLGRAMFQIEVWLNEGHIPLI